MRGWMICAAVAALLILIGQIRVGVAAQYGADGPLVKLRLGLIRIQLLPRKKKPKASGKQRGKQEKINPKAQKAPRRTAPEHAEAPKPSGDTQQTGPTDKPDTARAKGKISPDALFQLARTFVPLALAAAGCFWHRLVVDELELSITVGSADPADAAMLYGQIHAAIGALWQSANQVLHVKNGRAHVDMDFQTQNTTIYARAACSVKLGQLTWLGVVFGARALIQLIRWKRGQKVKQQQRKAV